MSRIIAWFAKNHVASNLLMALLVVGGLFTLPTIKQEVFPEIQLPVLSISVDYPGASPKEVEARFTDFWNLLSYSAVADGKLDDLFRPTAVESRQYHRPVQMILEADAPYARNPLNVALRPYVEKFFGIKQWHN